MLLELAMNSAETIGRRWWMVASGKGTPAEYRRMVLEKVKAAQETGVAMFSKNAGVAALLRPWHAGTRRNVKRLRKKS
jgi:hypothetical protein